MIYKIDNLSKHTAMGNYVKNEYLFSFTLLKYFHITDEYKIFILLKRILFLILSACMSHVQVCVGECNANGCKKAIFLELELQAIVSWLTWMLNTESQSFIKTYILLTAELALQFQDLTLLKEEVNNLAQKFQDLKKFI